MKDYRHTAGSDRPVLTSAKKGRRAQEPTWPNQVIYHGNHFKQLSPALKTGWGHSPGPSRDPTGAWTADNEKLFITPLLIDSIGCMTVLSQDKFEIGQNNT